MRYLLPAIAALGVALPAIAQTEPGHRMELVEIGPGPKANFYKEIAGCPAHTAACRRPAYVVAGDQLLVTDAQGEFTYVTFIPQRGRTPTEGWIETARLRRVLVPARFEAWLGDWRQLEGDISIRRSAKRGWLELSGNATYGAFDPERVKNGSVHTGEFSGSAVPHGDTVVVDEGDGGCRVELTLIGPYLIAADNNQCGGVNVRFMDVYRR